MSTFSIIISKLETLKYPYVNEFKRELKNTSQNPKKNSSQQQQEKKISPLTSPHQNKQNLSFFQFTKVVNFLENQHIRQFDDNERRQLIPIHPTGDTKQYCNALESYLSKTELSTPVLLLNLVHSIVPPASPSPAQVSPSTTMADVSTPTTMADVSTPTDQKTEKTEKITEIEVKPLQTKDSIARTQLLSFLVSKSIEYDHQDQILQRESAQKISETTKNTKKDAISTTVAAVNAQKAQHAQNNNQNEQKQNGKNGQNGGLLQPQPLITKPSAGATLTDKGHVKLFTNIVPEEFNFLILTKNLLKNQKENEIFLKKLKNLSKINAKIDESLVLKEVDRMTQSMSSAAPKLHKTLMKNLKLYSAIPINIPGNTNKEIEVEKKDRVDSSEKKNSPNQKKNNNNNGKKNQGSLSTVIEPTVEMVNLFDITIDNEDNMDLWQYITYVSTLYAYSTNLTDKINLHFVIPKPISTIALAISSMTLDTYTPVILEQSINGKDSGNIDDNSKKMSDEIIVVTAEKVVSVAEKNDEKKIEEKNLTSPKKQLIKSPKPSSTSSFQPTLLSITDNVTDLWVLAKATHMMILSVFREFTRRVESELTTTALALKALQPTQNDINMENYTPLFDFFNEIAPESIRNIQKDAQNGRKDAQNGENGENNAILMPSHIFPAVNANPHALKKAAKEFNDQRKAEKVAETPTTTQKGGKNVKNATKTEQNSQETAATITAVAATLVVVSPPTETTKAEIVENFGNMPVRNANKADLTQIRQKPLKKENFAVRNQIITDYVSGRFHLQRLVWLATLSSQEALFKISTLATLPLGAEATKKQQEQLAAFGKASLTKKDKKIGGDVAALSSEKTEISPEKSPKTGSVSPQHFIAILTTLVHLLYDQQLQQQQNIITRWIQYLQTFTARTHHQGSK